MSQSSPSALDRGDAARVGMLLAWVARGAPERTAIVSRHGERSFRALNGRANQLVRALRARGIGPGDSIAMVCANRPEFAEIYFAGQRAGLRLTPINWHLTGGEIAYILDDCGARAFLCDARFGDAGAEAAHLTPGCPVRLALAGAIAGFEDHAAALARESDEDIADAVQGSTMLYTSGTTGRPKGVDRGSAAGSRPGQRAVQQAHAYQPGVSVHLATGPLYHAAPLGFSLALPLSQGCTVVMMDGWDAAGALELVARHRVTHTHMVPIMFHHLLSLPESERERHDLSSLRMVLHGAAPCPVAVKRALIEWLGPVVYEYYAATEGWGSFVDSEQWLAKPGSVGRPDEGQIRILDEQGAAQPAGVAGLVYMHSPQGFRYHADVEKTRQSFRGEFFTLGDVGYLDEDGFLFLCDRSADLIISGGVNVYPAEVDAVLLEHPAVRDAATVGVPDEVWGESVLSVVEPRPGAAAGPALAEELIAWCRARLAHYKCPRRVEFSDDLPRFETGKIYRRLLRERYRAEAARAEQSGGTTAGRATRSTRWT